MQGEDCETGDKDSFEILDNIQMDFFYLIKGECSLEFEVTKIYDPNELTTEETIS